MADTARITVTAGPDKGRVYDLKTEIVRLGRASGNEISLTDAQVLDQHASIVCREGRFAIHTSVPDGIDIDGTQVPPERWVWLPEVATIRLGARTFLEFAAAGTEAASPVADRQAERQAAGQTAGGTTRPGASSTVSGTTTAPREKGTGKSKHGTESPASGSSDTQPRSRRSGDRAERAKKGTIARFITDGPGDPLVKLGEDGHLPELMLHEAHSGERPDAGPKQSNPVVLLSVFGLSFGLILLMLFTDVGSYGGSAKAKEQARQEIMEYYGKEPLQPYQESLREAQRARSRRDFDGERRSYREVLAQLRSEARDQVTRFTGLTGRRTYDTSSEDTKSDQRLEELIGILLSE